MVRDDDKTVITLRVERSLRDEIDRIARADGRPIANWLRRVVLAELQRVQTQQPAVTP